MQMFTDGMINFHHAYSKLIYAALIMAFAYSYSQDLRGQKIGIFGLPMQVEALYLPLMLLFMTWIVKGPTAVFEQATGIVAAHMYDFLTTLWPKYGGGKPLIWTRRLGDG